MVIPPGKWIVVLVPLRGEKIDAHRSRRVLTVRKGAHPDGLQREGQVLLAIEVRPRPVIDLDPGTVCAPPPSATTVELPLSVTVPPTRFSSQVWTSIIPPASKGGRPRNAEARR